MIRYTALLISLLILFGCSLSMSNLKVDDEYQHSLSVSGDTYPLPAGIWTLIAKQYSDTNKFLHLVLLQHNNNIVSDLLVIVVDAPANRYDGYRTCKYCARDDVHFSRVYSNSLRGDQNCWILNHYIVTELSETVTGVKKVREYFRVNGLNSPKLMIQGYHRFAESRSSNFLAYNNFRNPEAYGFNVPNNLEWDSCSWHPLQINDFPKKKAYIKKSIKDGKLLHNKLENAFFK